MQALPGLEGANRIHTYFDNDKAGRATYGQLRSANFPVYDRSCLYADYNDFNDMIRQRPVQNPL
ncbi:toprim domain-containing protein [Spirosoma sp. KCTC 42546]|nr:toprim domain-containing protein [Spirosoma sp. KCTC 42546]